MKLRKSYFLALAVSFVVLCVSGVIAVEVIPSIPSSAIGQQMRFIEQNHGNPAVYTSSWYRSHSQAAGMEDFLVTCPAMLLAGLALGLLLTGRTTWPEAITYSVVTGIVLAVSIFGLDWFGTTTAARLNMQTGTAVNMPKMNATLLLAAALNALVWTALYSVGGLAGHAIRRRFSPPSALPPAPRKPSAATTAS